MKKYFVLIVLFFLIGGISAQAQLKFGIKGGVTMSNISFKLKDVGTTFDPENLTGFQAGPMIEVMSPLGLGLDFAVLYSQQGFKIDWSKTNNNGVTGVEEYKLNTLQIPLNLKGRIALLPKLLKVYGTAGPYISFDLSDNLKDQWKNQSFRAGLNFGFGFELIKHLQIGANYQLELTNDYGELKKSKDNIINLHDVQHRVWSVSAAYLF